ncbi:MAG: SusF/SusE family outer membrane protein [Bacteroidota bacterium]|nr:SusF/SusE family outer membrane protein [Bacteroidota bacterium]
MKRTIKMSLWGLLLLLFTISCDESYMELNKGETPLALSVNHNELALNIKVPDNTALTFTWTSGTNKGTNCAMTYQLQLDKAGNNFKNAVSHSIGKNIFKLEYTNAELNAIIKDTFHIEYGSTADLEARIIAIPADTSVEQQVSESVPLKITSYKPVSSTLYLIGDATPNGWSLDKATKMNPISGEAGGFVWIGDLSTGNFKFLTTNTGWMPSYNKDATSGTPKLVYRDADTQPDEQFTIEKTGSYRIAVNLIDLTISITAMKGPKYEKIFFVGSFTNWGFVEMRRDPSNSYIFRYGAVLNYNGGGEFKFATAENSWDNMYHPTIANAPYTHSEAMQNDNGDYKWNIPQADCGKAYKMALNITEGSESLTMSVFTPYETLYLVGDATPSGWSIDKATAMTKTDDYTQTWTGQLTAGDMKITCDKQGDWMGAWFMAAANGEVPTGSEQYMTFVDKIHDSKMAEVDRKWKIKDAGTYKITCNQLTESITIAKQ